MNSYFGNILPLGPTVKEENDFSTQEEKQWSSITRLAIFNSSFADERSEKKEELIKQIICFIHTEESSDRKDEEELNFVGLIRGLIEFNSNFTPKEVEKATTIKTNKSIIIVKVVEQNYHIICQLRGTNDDTLEIAGCQLARLVDRAYRYFVLFNQSFEDIRLQSNVRILKSQLMDFWSNFVHEFNAEESGSNLSSSWMKKTNNNGFLGLLDWKTESVTYRKSSIHLTKPIEQFLQASMGKCTSKDDQIPQAILISSFDRQKPNNYGFIYKGSAYDDSIEDNIIPDEQLLDIHNYLEFLDLNDTLETQTIMNSSSRLLFNHEPKEQQIYTSSIQESGTSIQTSEITENSTERTIGETTLDALHPVNFANNYFLSPLNSTINSVRYVGSHINTEDLGVNAFMNLPSNLKYYVTETFNPQQNVPQVEHSSDADEEIIEEPQGKYIVGCSDGQFVSKKVIYLGTKSNEKNEGSDAIHSKEYILIVYRRQNFVVSLVYDSSMLTLDNPNFYRSLEDGFLGVLTDDLLAISDPHTVSNSIGSLSRTFTSPSEQRQQTKPEESTEKDFHFIIYNDKFKWVNSSLPHLEDIKSTGLTPDDIEKKIKHQRALRSLHRYLCALFISGRRPVLDSSVTNEYFHKINISKSFVWMIYFIRSENRSIIVIKSQTSKSSKKERRRKGPEKSEATSTQVGNILNDSRYYMKLSFLDNLGFDVRSWLENLTLSDQS
ncbi:Piso0_005550 [Millerozyma farinosa CBS 7064]|uniref:Piso0_005550 protein n=1 Tax=Pichia sorbitophila (strain ATCC MYA-4447 / BCRC 22081 / CBS 7064 / NBRC 10061 / NRRL Y-12695) TaxID=559304 RepID=G8Y2A0_PICSO|nr:Piso0_005550 [Millerozyma farinosa CBS 7064]